MDMGERPEKRTSGAKARVGSAGGYTRDESRAYRPQEFFSSL
jgi:hypothetical protein